MGQGRGTGSWPESIKLPARFARPRCNQYSGSGGPGKGSAIALAQAPPQAGPVVGHVLMLDNESVLEGEITREGDCYVIKRPVGEVKVPVAKAMVVCASMDEAFKILSSRRNLRDADERVRLARWCQTHGMHDQAVPAGDVRQRVPALARTGEALDGPVEVAGQAR